MQLPAFISRLALFADKAEERLDQIAAAQKRADALDAEVTRLRADLEKAVTLNNATADEAATKAEGYRATIAELTAKLEKAERSATETIAAQGIPADRIPSQAVAGPGEHVGKPDTSKMSLTEQCLAARKQKIVTK